MGKAVQVEALWNGLRDNSGQPLAAGKVYAYSAGTTSPKDLFTAADKSAAATNPLILNAYGRSQVWADGAYKFEVRTSADAVLYTLDNLVYGYDDGQILWGGTSGGTGNAQTISVSGSVTAYVAGQRFIFIAGNTNTGATTVNVNSIGAVSLNKGDGTVALSSGDIASGDVVDCVYETGGGGRLRLLSRKSAPEWGGTTGGTASAYTLTPSPAWKSITTGDVISFMPHASNTGSATLNVSGLGAANLVYMGQALVGGELVSGVVARARREGTTWHLLNHGGGWATWTPTWPTFNTQTFTSVTVNTAIYQRHGSRVIFSVDGTGTATGGPSMTFGVAVTPPISTSATQGAFGASVADAGTSKGGFTLWSGGDIIICKYDRSNIVAGTVQVAASGEYKV